MMSPLNFPWIGRNPPKVGAAVFLFALVLFLPLSVLALVTHRHMLLLLPLSGAACVSLPIWAANLWICSRVRRLDARLKAEGGEIELQAPCSMVRGSVRKPGIVAVRGTTLYLFPVFGRSTEIPLEQIRSVSEVKWFNGRLLFGKARGFWLAVGQEGRLGFAVEDPEAWRAVLRDSRKSRVNVECCDSGQQAGILTRTLQAANVGITGSIAGDELD